MKIIVTGGRKTTKRNGKGWVNVFARIITSCELCNLFEIRVGDALELKINGGAFVAKVSDFITIPSKLVFDKSEMEQIKNGLIIKKEIDIEIVNIHRQKLKFNRTEELVGILAHLFSDGCISATNVHFTNTDKELVTHFNSLMRNCFPKSKIEHRNRDDNILHVQVDTIGVISILSRFVERFGRKSVTNPHVPEFIKNDALFSKVWLKHVFSDEGSINGLHTVHLTRQVRFKNDELLNTLEWFKEPTVLKGGFELISARLTEEQTKLVPQNNLIEDEKQMLRSLGINSRLSPRKRVRLVNGDISATFDLSVRSRDFIRIGFCSNRKQQRLENIYSTIENL